MEFGAWTVLVFLVGFFAGGYIFYAEGKNEGIKWCQDRMKDKLEDTPDV